MLLTLGIQQSTFDVWCQVHLPARILWQLEDHYTAERYQIAPESTGHLIAPTPPHPPAPVQAMLSELQQQNRFRLGERLGNGATGVAHVVFVDGVRYAGKEIIALSSESMRETYGMDTTEAIHDCLEPRGILGKLLREIDIMRGLEHRGLWTACAMPVWSRVTIQCSHFKPAGMTFVCQELSGSTA